jgi:hypothetical protein
MDVTVGAIVDGTACPYLQFESGDSRLAATENQTVPAYKRFGTDRLTRYEGGACSDIATGAKLRVSGTKRKQDEAVHVSSVVFKAKKPAAVPVAGRAVVVRTLDDTKCPALGFKLGTYAALVDDAVAAHTVRVTEATRYESGSCESIKTGSTIVFSGEKHADGSIVVLSIAVKEVDPAGGVPHVVEIGLKVSDVPPGTSCPLLVFKAGSHTVKTSLETEYVGGLCSDIAVGRRLLVQGLVAEQVVPQRKAVPKTVLVTRITFLVHESTK